jgi:xanthine phosphoribosyltransferase
MPAAGGGADRPEILISKEQLERDIASLADRVAGFGERWRGVVGVANGGIYPAGRVADRLNLDYREIRISAYRGRTKTTPQIIRGLDDADRGAGLIVVDDIVDSGDTALLIRRMLPRAALLVVYVKAAGLDKLRRLGQAPLYAECHPQDSWIVFPWHQAGWAGEVPLSVSHYRSRVGLDGSIPITRQ